MLAEKGAETVKLQSQSSENSSLTALGTISAAGQKLPLRVLAKGKTHGREPKFGAHPDAVIRHTDSGWATEDLIVAHIEWLHRGMAKGHPCILSLDVYPSHRTNLVCATADAKTSSFSLCQPVAPKGSNP
jgi:hypothetical protein